MKRVFFDESGNILHVIPGYGGPERMAVQMDIAFSKNSPGAAL